MAKKTKQNDASHEQSEELGFEEAVEKLEQIIDAIESGEVGLERSIREYERGMQLIRRCRSILDHAEQRVRELSEEDGDESEAPENDA